MLKLLHILYAVLERIESCFCVYDTEPSGAARHLTVCDCCMDIEDKWLELLHKLEAPRQYETVYAVGGNDSGKTTLCRFLDERLRANFVTASINCDPGQASIGPPACLGMTVSEGDSTTMMLRFVGATSPFGHMTSILSGSRRLVDEAAGRRAQKIAVDSSGFDHSPAGLSFQFETIDLLQPTTVVGIARNEDERESLDGLMRNFKKAGMAYFPLTVHPAGIKRSAEERKAFRESRFSRYFKDARIRTIDFRTLGLHGRLPENGIGIAGRLIALSDSRQLVVTLGIAQHSLVAPPSDAMP